MILCVKASTEAGIAELGDYVVERLNKLKITKKVWNEKKSHSFFTGKPLSNDSSSSTTRATDNKNNNIIAPTCHRDRSS